MATSVRLIRRYVWLVDTIRRAGHISLEDINRRWLDNYTLNPDHEGGIPERTFHRHRDAIAELFGVDIACDRTTNAYYIRDDEELNQPSFTAWLFNGLSLDNQLITHEGVKSRIMFEDTPYGSQYLSVIVEAMSTNHVLAMSYRSYNRPEETEWLIEPRGLKQYRRRWYLIGNKYGEDTPLTFALDRIESLEISDKIFDSDNGENLNELFSEVVGVFVDPDLDVEDITVRVYGKQRNYFEGTPLHHSQRVIERHTEYTDYGFCLRPEYEFQHEILRLGPGAEVLSPQWLRNDMVWYANRILERYKS
ncbi:MAG: WYL domain-containing protein [Bacteroides sp.]|nr:WYL domain-containing protein [Bacteroides sp.]MCM1472349.1 WYL domain-containing protein [Bacteroides sp.]